MDIRIKFSVWLIGAGIILALLPGQSGKTFQLKAPELLEKSVSPETAFSADQVAGFINNEDSTILLIDLRSEDEYRKCNLPGSIHIPFEDLLNTDWQGYLNQPEVRKIYYGNGDYLANIAWSVVTGLEYENSYVMTGGMNEWYRTVMLSRFEGEKITPRENAIFENRFRARRTFTQMNSLPDSVRIQFLAARRAKESMLDGGCE